MPQARAFIGARARKRDGATSAAIARSIEAINAREAIIAPNAAETAGKLHQARTAVQQWMWREFRGALGIVIPHVDTAQEAKEIVDRLRYAPLGHRSVGGGQAQFDYAPMKMADMIKRSNDNTLITVMIETPKAVRNAEAIAAVPGIDSLLVGSSDLSVELGIPGQNGHEKVQAAVDKVVAACKKHRKFPGMGGAYSEELLALLPAIKRLGTHTVHVKLHRDVIVGVTVEVLPVATA